MLKSELFVLKVTNRLSITCLLLLTSSISVRNAAFAQIIPDSTLPNNSSVTPNGSNLTPNSSATVQITGGTTAGSNLFHSFQEFSLPQSNIVNFDNFTDIENIFTRVTGSNISTIDGLVSANGSANLFFINPKGIVLGENATLDIGGSFIGSTANSIVFQDGNEFSAVDPNAPPLLTINAPLGLNMSTEGGEIVVEGTGNSSFFDFDFFIPVIERPTGVEVDLGKTLALIGNGILLEGGNLTAKQGKVELGSVNRQGIVNISETEGIFDFNYNNINDFGDIIFTEAASIDASGNGGGIVQLTGKNISLIDGSLVVLETLGDGDGGLLKVRATETVELLRDNPDTGFWTSFLADSVEGSTGKSGNIVIESNNLNLIDGGQITSVIYGEGDGGNIDIVSDNIELSGFNEDEFGILGSSGIYTTAEFTAFGQGGDINIDAQKLEVTNEAQVAALTWGEGKGGSVNIDAEEVSVTELGLVTATAQEFSFGDAGNIDITTGKLYIANSGDISSNTHSEGDAGKITIAAETIELTEGEDFESGFPTGIFSSSRPDAFGNGGTIEITADNLSLNNGSQIQSVTFSSGDGGKIAINAQNINLSGFNASAKTAIVASAITGSGDGGNVEINSENLSLRDGATVSVSNFSTSNPDRTPGSGKAGNIAINSQFVDLDSNLAEEKSAITASSFADGGGNISLNAESIALKNGSQVTSETQGVGEGGNLNLQANSIEIQDLGEISVSSTGTGDAGDIAIAAGIFNLDRGEVLATATEAGGGEINLETDSLMLDNSSSISTSVLGGDGGGGNIAIDNNNFVIGKNSSSIKADAVQGDGGNIQIDTLGLFFDATSSITASSEFGLDGIVEVNDLESANKLSTLTLANNVMRVEAVIAQKCPAPKANTFALLNKGGLPDNPTQYLRGQVVWQDLRMLEDNNLQAQRSAIPIEARSWQINSSGNVELNAQNQSDKIKLESFFCSAVR